MATMVVAVVDARRAVADSVVVVAEDIAIRVRVANDHYQVAVA